MKTSLVPVPLSRIDWDDQTFVIRSFTPSDSLEASLDRHGALFPPWVWVGPDGKRSSQSIKIVDGFKRLQWARSRGLEIVECVAFPPEAQRAELVVRRIEARLFGSPLNTPEKARILAMLLEALAEEQVISLYLPALRLAPRLDVLEQWCRLAGSGDDLLRASASDGISERAALELATWEAEEREAMIGLLVTLRCTASIQAELLERITEIALGRGKGRAELLADPEIQAILREPRSNRRQKTQSLRDLLMRWRFPRLHAREGRYRSELERASLPAELRLMPPAFFEGERWQLQISFSNPEGLKKALEWSLGFSGSAELERLLED